MGTLVCNKDLPTEPFVFDLYYCISECKDTAFVNITMICLYYF